jgi:SHS2 domain-containing protein
MAEDETLPLSQRQSGRQQRRDARRKASVPAEPIRDTPTNPRGPSEENERRIAESIGKRKKSNAAAAVISADLEEKDYNEILGTYEYLDHTADIQLHSWGDSIELALEALAMAMFGYMTKISLIEVNDADSVEWGSSVQIQAHDLTSLVFNFLQEWLCIFHETKFVPRTVTIHSLDWDSFSIVCSGQGETMKTHKHVQGTEVKAVTYSNLQVIQSDSRDRWDIWVILDI